MKYVFIGDVHGKVDAVEEALSREGHKVFVGDFIDSFDRSLEDHKKCYDLVFAAIDKGDAMALYGNHELSYYVPSQRCSGWAPDRASLMLAYEKDIKKRFKNYLFLGENILVTHAGLTKQLFDDHIGDMKYLDETLQIWENRYNTPMYWIGASRGGPSYNSYGGTFWCDFRYEFAPVEGLMQIFGHTRGKGIRQTGYSYCIDCLNWKDEDNDNPYTFLELEI